MARLDGGCRFSLAIEYHREDDGRWLADIPALPGVTAYGRTKKAATVAVQALALRLIADRLEHGEAVPGRPGLYFIGYRNPLTGALHDIAREAPRVAALVAGAP